MFDHYFRNIWLSKEKYLFHWQRNGSIIRFDNAPHHEEVDSFPDHIHINAEVRQTPVNGNYVEKTVQAVRYIRKKKDLS